MTLALFGSMIASSKTDAQTRVQTTSFTGEETRWTFKLRNDPRVHRSVVVMSDVIEPVTDPLPAWSRLSRVRVGLMPVEGNTVTVERNRLARMIEAYHQTANQIEILGPETCVVRFQSQHSERVAAAPKKYNNEIAQASYEQIARVSSVPPPDVNTKARVDRWVRNAVQRFVPSLQLGFDYQFSLSNEDYKQLAMMTGVDGCRLLEDIEPSPSGSEFQLELAARVIGEPLTLTVAGSARPHPKAVVSKRMIGRGILLTHADVELRPVPGSKLHEGVLTRMEDVIGKETRGNIRVGTVLQGDDIGEPVLIHRGDLIDLAVMARGIKVTTTAKAVSNGSLGELIQVETTQPRERLAARVSGRGSAEILTRTPVAR